MVDKIIIYSYAEKLKPGDVVVCRDGRDHEVFSVATGMARFPDRIHVTFTDQRAEWYIPEEGVRKRVAMDYKKIRDEITHSIELNDSACSLAGQIDRLCDEFDAIRVKTGTAPFTFDTIQKLRDGMSRLSNRLPT